MATNYPTSIDDFATTSPSELGDADTTGRVHSQRHNDMESAMEAVQLSLLTGAAWTAYTPTLGGFTLGNGTWSAAYARVGKACTFRAVLTFGTTTTAATAFVTITLPLAALAATNVAFTAQFVDVSASEYHTAASRQSSTTVVTIGLIGSTGVIGPASLHRTLTATTPFTWATGDQIILTGTYQLA